MLKNEEFPINYFGQRVNNIPSKDEILRDLCPHRKYLIEFINGLPNGAKILDAGCGNGKMIRLILSFRPDIDIYAIDISNVADFLPKEAHFRKISIEEIDDLYEEDFFDAIICIHVIELLIYPIKTIENFKKILKNNGRIYMETPNWARALIPILPSFFWNDYTHIRIFTKETMRKLFFDFDFDLYKIKTVCSASLRIHNKSPFDQIYNVGRGDKKNKKFVLFIIVKKIILKLISLTLKDILCVVAINKKK
ncbi:MAG: class I SAM-dependent methyltransferase [Patescibacteria group bacterium]|nr:class I SAM-dependent methyltransferase [Patescibacteria group bacterium]